MSSLFELLVAGLPLALIAITLVLLMLAIAWRRHIDRAFYITIGGLNLALVSLLILVRLPTQDVTPLLRLDGYAIFYMALVLVAALASCTFARAWLRNFPDNREEFYLLLLIATSGGLILAMTQHLASLFIGIELISLPMFGLVGYSYRERRSLEAGIKYMVLSATATGFLLFGMALVYAQAGSLSFSLLGQVLAHDPENQPLFLAGMGMMLVGFAFKLSVVPFHLWTPDVYEGAPAPVGAFLATASKVAIFCALLRLYLAIPVAESHMMHLLLSLLAVLSILGGNLLALLQNNIKRMLGYSSVAHFGYLLAIIVATRQQSLALEATGVYLLMYLFTTLGAFGVVSLMSSPYGGKDAASLHSYRGLFWHRPYLTAVLTVMMLSLAGIPTTLGFVGKFYILAVGVSAQLWWITGSVIVGSALGLFYYLRVMVTLYLREPGQQERDAEALWGLSAGGIVVLLSGVVVIVLGLFPQPLLQLLQLVQISGVH